MPRTNRWLVALCVALPWACTPDSDAGPDASMTDGAVRDVAPDGAATFACYNETLRCNTGRQFCYVRTGGAARPGGSAYLYYCGDLPTGCSRCDCTPEARASSGSSGGVVQCVDTPPGEIRITVLGS